MENVDLLFRNDVQIQDIFLFEEDYKINKIKVYILLLEINEMYNLQLVIFLDYYCVFFFLFEISVIVINLNILNLQDILFIENKVFIFLRDLEVLLF